MPVIPMLGSWAWAGAAAVCASLTGRGSSVGGGVGPGGPVVLEREAVHAEERQEPAPDDLVHADEQAGDHDGQGRRQQERPVGRRRHVDGGDLLRGRRARPRTGLAAVAVPVLLQPERVTVVDGWQE